MASAVLLVHRHLQRMHKLPLHMKPRCCSFLDRMRRQLLALHALDQHRQELHQLVSVVALLDLVVDSIPSHHCKSLSPFREWLTEQP